MTRAASFFFFSFSTDGRTDADGWDGRSCDPMPMFVAHARFQFAFAVVMLLSRREGGGEGGVGDALDAHIDV